MKDWAVKQYMERMTELELDKRKLIERIKDLESDKERLIAELNKLGGWKT
jgi:hypothetical protein